MGGSSETRSDGGSTVETELDRDIGLVGAVALGVGTMIAAGIFVLSGLAVSNVGAMAITSFLIAAVVASFTAFAYAEFASIYPESGGGYAYVANVFETDLTYVVGWSMILGYPASAAFYLASFSDWFYRFIYPVLDVPAAVPYWLSGLAALGLLLAINLKGTEETGLFQIVVTALKVALIILFLYGGLQAFDADVVTASFAENLDQFRQIGVTSALVFITFFGFEAIATNAEEIESPGRTVPRAIFISMGFVTIVYTLVVLVIVIAVHDVAFLQFLANAAGLESVDAARAFVAENGEVSMGRAAQYYLGDFGFYVIIVGALLSMLSAANATILAGSRVKLAMGRRDHLPATFEELHPSLNTPYKSVLLTGALITFFVGVFTVVFGGVPGSEATANVPLGIHLGIDAMAHFADFMLLTGLVAVNIAVIYSRRRSPDIERGFEVPAVPWIPILAVLANLVLLVNVEFESLVLGVLAEVVGIALWFGVIGRGPTTERIERETPTVVAEGEPTESTHTLLVSIANPEHVEQFMNTAIDVARDREGDLLVMSAVVLPEQTPLVEGRPLAEERREVLDRALAVARDADVPASGVIRIGHDPADAILHTAVQHDCDAVLLGWRGRRHHRRDVVLGSNVDQVATEAESDVLVEKIGSVEESVESILLATAGGPHAELAAETARAVARAEGASVEVVHVVEPDATESERADAREILADTGETLDSVPAVERRLLEGEDIADAIVEESADHDLVVIGATRESPLQRLVFGAIPETVGEEADATVIMTKRHLDITSRLSGLLGRGGS